MIKNFIRAAFILPGLMLSNLIVAQPVSWYRSFTGTIGNYPVTMHLHKMGPAVNGYYYYHSRMQPIYLVGDDTSAGKNRITMYGAINEIFTLTLQGDNSTGIWKKDSESKTSLPVKLIRKKDAPLQFDMIFTTGSLPLRANMPESPEANYSAASIWPRGDAPVVNLIKQVVNEEFGEKNSLQDVGKIFLQRKKKFFAEYMEENRDVNDSLLLEYPSSYSMEESQWLTIAFHSPKILTLADLYYSYMGGAHGNYSTSYISLDLLSNKKLKLSDVLTPAGIAKLNPLLEKYFRKERDLGPADDLTEGGLFENNIEANENFYITSRGIGFSYAPYEIAPYAAGEINIFIPFTELTAYLQPGFKKLIQ